MNRMLLLLMLSILDSCLEMELLFVTCLQNQVMWKLNVNQQSNLCAFIQLKENELCKNKT